MKHNEAYYIQPPSHDVFFQCFRLPKEGEDHQLHTAAHLYSVLTKRFPKAMRGMNANQFGKTLMAIGAERVHTMQGMCTEWCRSNETTLKAETSPLSAYHPIIQ